MSAANAFETALLQHILQNANIANIGDATGLRGSSTAGVLYVSLHTADPGEAGDQTTNECAYTNYARVSVVRSAAGWNVTNNVGSNAAAVSFPQSGSGPEVATHFAIGTASSGSGNLLLSGALNSSLTINNLITPNFAIDALTVTLD
jgi:hypothetical protein